MIKYELVKPSNGNALLYRNGLPQICPFVGYEAKAGTAAFNTCGDWCPHFGVIETELGFSESLQGEVDSVRLSCGGTIREIPITNEARP